VTYITDTPVIDKTDPDRSVYLIPEANYGRLIDQIEKLNKRVQRFGGKIMKPFVVGYQQTDDGQVYEVYLDVGKVAIEGWTFAARIDHSQETGNIIRALPNSGITIPEDYRSTPSTRCDHCNTKRQRRDTFVLFNEQSGEFKQVGSTCLSDFLGVDAAYVGRLAEVYGYADEAARAGGNGGGSVMQDHRYVTLDEFLAHTAAVIRQHGWLSGGNAYQYGGVSTRERAILSYQDHSTVTAEDREVAGAARDWAMAFDDITDRALTDYEYNVLVVAKAMVIEYRACGLAASIVGCYIRERDKNKPRAQRVQLNDVSRILALFDTAAQRLKLNGNVRPPKVTVDLPHVGIVVLSMAGPQSVNAGMIYVKGDGSYESASYYGKITRDGQYRPTRDALPQMHDALAAFAVDPAGIAAAHGHKTGRCCFCHKKLTTKESTAVGYGPDCADHYNLPWGNKETA
jgi:hypothetical protein